MITAASFPVPQRILTGDPAKDLQFAAFAQHQVKGARSAVEVLGPLWHKASGTVERVHALEAAHAAVVGWRYDLACSNRNHVHGHVVGPERFLIPIDDKTLNWDRLNPTTKDGPGTPGFATMQAVEAMARQQFEHQPGRDTIRHVVELGDTALIGTTLVRGLAARQVADEVTRRLNSRGIIDVDFGPDPIFARNPCDSSRAAFFQHALKLLAAPGAEITDVRVRWYQALYLLLLSPKYKRGGDAIARTFAVAAAEVVLDGDIPPYPHDVDFRAFVLSQNDFLREVTS